MKEFFHNVAGRQCSIKLAEYEEDLNQFLEWVRRNQNIPLAVDTETTGLDRYSPGFRCRLVQFGTEYEAWVVPVEKGARFRGAVLVALHRHAKITFHNAAFDVTVLTRQLGVSAFTLWNKLTDTQIMAKLIDPRNENSKLGDVGHKLKALSSKHIDPNAPDTQQGLHAAFKKLPKSYFTKLKKQAKEEGWSADDVLAIAQAEAANAERPVWDWATIPNDHPTYITYAGLDVIFTARLRSLFVPAVAAKGLTRLAWDEHKLARICWQIENRGVLADYEYAKNLYADLDEEYEKWADVALGLGVENIGSTQQVADALLAEGVQLTKRNKPTEKMLEKDPEAQGNWCVDEKVLRALAGWNKDWEPVAPEQSKLAGAIMRAKRAKKWREAYVVGSLSQADADMRVHPWINSIAARTGRMSVSSPPLQQLPAGDKRIRKMYIAEPGEVIVSVDYAAVEMRILAAHAGVKRMIEAIKNNEDLHDYTASLINAPRKVAKTVGFGKVYGGGAKGLSEQSGLPIGVVAKAIKEYNRVYPEVNAYSRRLQDQASSSNPIRSRHDRILICDEGKGYALLNYDIQSSAKDVLMQGILEMDQQGLIPYVRLLVHDEVVASAPKGQAKEIAQAIAEAMRVEDYWGVPLDTDVEIGEGSWGSIVG